MDALRWQMLAATLNVSSLHVWVCTFSGARSWADIQEAPRNEGGRCWMPSKGRSQLPVPAAAPGALELGWVKGVTILPPPSETNCLKIKSVPSTSVASPLVLLYPQQTDFHFYYNKESTLFKVTQTSLQLSPMNTFGSFFSYSTLTVFDRTFSSNQDDRYMAQKFLPHVRKKEKKKGWTLTPYLTLTNPLKTKNNLNQVPDYLWKPSGTKVKGTCVCVCVCLFASSLKN